MSFSAIYFFYLLCEITNSQSQAHTKAQVHEGKMAEGDGESNKRKRSSSTTAGTEAGDDISHRASLETSYKRIILSLTKPSYLLGRHGFNHLRQENRTRLYRLLHKLVRQHDWTEAAGVLAVLLRATRKDTSPVPNRFKYSVSMEILRHLDSERIGSRAIENMYDTWMMRVGINLSNTRKRNTKEDSFVVRLESILFQLMSGNVEAERQNAKSLMQEHEFENHPMFNMIIGLIFYHLWYCSIPDDMQWKDSEETYTSIHSDVKASPSQSDTSASSFNHKNGYAEENNSIFSVQSNSFIQNDSSTSVRKDKEIPLKPNTEFYGEPEVLIGDVNLKKENVTQPQGFYVNSVENEASDDDNCGDIHSSTYFPALERLDLFLLPLQAKIWELDILTNDDEYKNAVKYLRKAIDGRPPMLGALLPLIQLLLIGCKDKDALNELEKFCGISSTALPIRLRAKLLEHVDPNNCVLLATCFEEILKNDPTCTLILEKLLNLRKNGEYSPESLLEMIALHLDAVFAEYNTWREFALCFLEVSQYEEDRMSACLHGNEVGKKQYLSARYNRIPKFLVHGKSGQAWQFRCKWWLRRYFSKSMLATEITAGDLRLVAYKAACASHMYGREFIYVRNAYSCIEKGNNRDLLSFLKLHMQNSIELQLNIERRTN